MHGNEGKDLKPQPNSSNRHAHYLNHQGKVQSTRVKTYQVFIHKIYPKD